MNPIDKLHLTGRDRRYNSGSPLDASFKEKLAEIIEGRIVALGFVSELDDALFIAIASKLTARELKALVYCLTGDRRATLPGSPPGHSSE